MDLYHSSYLVVKGLNICNITCTTVVEFRSSQTHVQNLVWLNVVNSTTPTIILIIFGNICFLKMWLSGFYLRVSDLFWININLRLDFNIWLMKIYGVLWICTTAHTWRSTDKNIWSYVRVTSPSASNLICVIASLTKKSNWVTNCNILGNHNLYCRL